jgi:hypothetical protein
MATTKTLHGFQQDISRFVGDDYPYIGTTRLGAALGPHSRESVGGP